jgi:hypothetical protein
MMVVGRTVAYDVSDKSTYNTAVRTALQYTEVSYDILGISREGIMKILQIPGNLTRHPTNLV